MCLGRKANRGASFADEDRSDRDLKTIEQLRLKERRHRDAAPFHQHARAASRAQQLHYLRGLRGGVALVDIGDRRGADVAFARYKTCLSADIERWRLPIDEDSERGF